MSKLTAVQVRNAKPTTKSYKMTDCHGMHLHVSPTGKNSWRYRYRIAGRETIYVIDILTSGNQRFSSKFK